MPEVEDWLFIAGVGFAACRLIWILRWNRGAQAHDEERDRLREYYETRSNAVILRPVVESLFFKREKMVRRGSVICGSDLNRMFLAIDGRGSGRVYEN